MRWAAAALAAALAACEGGTAPCDPSIPGTICTVAGIGEAGDDPGPVAAADAHFDLPMDVLAAPGGELYIVDWNNRQIRRLGVDGTVTVVASGDASQPCSLGRMTNLMLEPGGQSLLVAGWSDDRVRRIDLASGMVSDVGGNGEHAYHGDGGPALDAALALPTAIALAPSGELLVMDQANQVIRAIDQDGTIRRVAGVCLAGGDGACEAGGEPVACPGEAGKMTCGDPATACNRTCANGYAAGDALSLRMAQTGGQLAAPGGRLALDGDGNLYFADPGNNLVRRISATDGQVSVVAGVAPEPGGFPVGGNADDGTLGTEALLNDPLDLAVADDGTVYFTDVFNHCVRALGHDQRIHTVAGVCGHYGYDGDGGPATQALLSRPHGLDLAGDRLYIADTYNDVIRVVTLPAP